ncbi:MAG: SH3 domain-containing protein [Desulforhopalus sp.]
MIKNYPFTLKKNIHLLSRIITFLFVIFSVFSVSLLHAEMLSIKGDSVNLRSGPGTKYSILWEYGEGFPVEIVQREKDWVKIKDFEDDTGWVHESLLVDRPHMIVKANRGNGEKINIRQSPSAEDKIVGKAYYGVVFEMVQQQSGWVEVKHESGLSGWISSVLLWGY